MSRIAALDGLRGLAILLVIVFHAWRFEPNSGIDLWVQRVVELGWSGVNLFFVLSGFLITSVLLEAKGAENYFRSFYGRRVLRIFPIYLLTLALFFALEPTRPVLHVDLGAAQADAAWYWLYLSNFVMAQHNDFGPNALGVTWSLAIEEQFYLVWPLLVLLLPRRALLYTCGVLIAVAVVWRVARVLSGAGAVGTYVLLPSQMDGLAVGAAIALLRSTGGLERVGRWALPGAGVSVAGLVVIGAVGSRSAALPLLYDTPLIQGVGYTLVDLVFGALVVWVLTTRTTRMLASAPLRLVGRCSYCMYLVHLPLIWVVNNHGLRALLVRPEFGSLVPGKLAYTAILIGLTLGVGLASWYVVERPILSLKRYLPYGGRQRETREERRPVMAAAP